MGKIEFGKLDNKKSKILLDCLGYSVNNKGTIFKKSTGKIHLCPITKEEVKLNEASILPGSTVIINTSTIALSEYFSRYLKANCT